MFATGGKQDKLSRFQGLAKKLTSIIHPKNVLGLLPICTIMEEKDFKETADFDINADSDVPGTSHLTEPIREGGEVGRLEMELAEMKDKYLRQFAEFDNFRKRTAKERLELIQTAGKEVIVQLLEVLDDAERAQRQMEQSKEGKALKEGVQLVFNKLRNIQKTKS